uniref:Uncharacterized protein n=1 Tax=Caenorhabditis japonica TaxID=281687 RepID=A0A8R1EG21_CAEJA
MKPSGIPNGLLNTAPDYDGQLEHHAETSTTSETASCVAPGKTPGHRAGLRKRTATTTRDVSFVHFNDFALLRNFERVWKYF